jgi:hypothetical protein
MTITFENDNDIIKYALEKIISYARRTQQIFVAQCAWWLASIIRLAQGLIVYIDNLGDREIITRQEGSSTISKNQTDRDLPKEPLQEYSGRIHPDRIKKVTAGHAVSSTPRDLTEDQCRDQILESVEQFIEQSTRTCDTCQSRKASGKSKTGRINQLASTNQSLRVTKKRKKFSHKEKYKDDSCSKTKGIEEAEMQRRKSEDECLLCAWASDWKGTHRVKDCI